MVPDSKNEFQTCFCLRKMGLLEFLMSLRSEWNDMKSASADNTTVLMIYLTQVCYSKQLLFQKVLI